MRIADRIKLLATDAGIPERQVKNTLAEVCGIKYQAVQQWFNSTNPAPDNLAAIAKFFQASLLWIITGEGPMKSTNLTDEELSIVESWRDFPEESRKKIIAQQLVFLESLRALEGDDAPTSSRK